MHNAHFRGLYSIHPQAGGLELPDYLTVEEVAEILGYNVESVRRLLRPRPEGKQPKLRGDKKGNMWLVYRESVEEFKEATEGKAKTDPTRGT
ncbi:MAG: hypothetical protein DRJ03_20010 [Chloroflexi bacterium]|nr:MAG: hypothetical protein DRI81_10440 [Chloroflexota bacterium]RLC81575.1 MAG: hypothetical protein DRJ03_20010 [Chloroflexota bacterium]